MNYTESGRKLRAAVARFSSEWAGGAGHGGPLGCGCLESYEYDDV